MDTPIHRSTAPSRARSSADEHCDLGHWEMVLTEQLHLSVDVAMEPPIHVSVSLDQPMALFLIAFSTILVVGFGFAAALMIVRAIRRR